MAPILIANKITVHFGGLAALSGVDVEVVRGGVTGVIGPNGAGKTTLFNVLTGFCPPKVGTVEFHPGDGEGRRIETLRPERIAGLGIARTFQNIRLFSGLGALDNIRTARRNPAGVGRFLGEFAKSLVRTRSFRAAESQKTREAFELLAFVGLDPALAARPAQDLAYGERRRLEIARALALEPKLLCLDEPAAGLNAAETAELAGLVSRIREAGVSVLCIEHDVGFVMRLCDHVVVLDYGQVIAAGPPAVVAADPAVRRAYLGYETQEETVVGDAGGMDGEGETSGEGGRV